jgi:hypothetical protein
VWGHTSRGEVIRQTQNEHETEQKKREDVWHKWTDHVRPVLWLLKVRGLVGTYRRFGGTYCIRAEVFGPEDGSSMFLWNDDFYLNIHMESQPRRRIPTSPPREPEIWCGLITFDGWIMKGKYRCVKHMKVDIKGSEGYRGGQKNYGHLEPEQVERTNMKVWGIKMRRGEI